jgi:hypothetical protein
MSKRLAALSVLCFAILAAVFAAGPASAAQQSLPSLSTLQAETLAVPARSEYRQYCVSQYFTCRDRWGGGSRFQRCMKWRGCWEAYTEFRERRERREHRRRYRDRDDEDDYEEDSSEGYSCRHWQKACAENWGYGNNDYYGCLRYHGCE